MSGVPGVDQPASGRIRSHLSFLVAGQAAGTALRFVAAILFARALSVHDYGLLNVGIAVAGIAVVGTMLGLPDQGARDVAIQRERASWIAGRVLSARLLATGLVCIIGVGATAAISPPSTAFAAITAAMALSAAASADWLLRGLESMSRLALALALGGAVVLAGAAVVAIAVPELLVALGVFALGELVTSLACWIGARRRAPPSLGLSGLGEMLRRSWPLAISTLALYLYLANFDTIVLAATRSAEDAGLYSAAYRLFLAANSVSALAAFAFLPVLATGLAESGGGESVIPSLRRSLRYLLAFGMAATAGAILAGELVLELLFGSEFGEMSDVLTVLSIALCWYMIGYPAGYTLIARERNPQLLRGAVVAAVANIALCFLLIPPYGPIGAAAATAAAFTCASLVWMRLHPELVGPLRRSVPTLVAVSAAAVGAITVDALRVPLALAILLGAGLVLAGARRTP